MGGATRRQLIVFQSASEFKEPLGTLVFYIGFLSAPDGGPGLKHCRNVS